MRKVISSFIIIGMFMTAYTGCFQSDGKNCFITPQGDGVLKSFIVFVTEQPNNQQQWKGENQ